MDTEHDRGGAEFMGLRVIALVEALLILAGLVVLDLLAGSGDRFMHVSPHPFWIPVLLVAAQYGALEGLAAACLASGALLIGNLPAMGFGEDPYNYVIRLAINPAMWLGAALVVGELRSQADRKATDLLDRLDEARDREQHLASAAEKLAAANRSLEERVAGQLRTVASLYEASRAVEQLGTGDVLVGIAELVRTGLNPKKFSLFLLNNQQLESVLSEGWTPTDRYTRIFGPATAMFREVIANHRHLCIASPKDQIVLGADGILAGPIYSSETGETIGMLKVEAMDAIEFNMTAVESFRVLCNWIGTAFSRARAFEQATSRSFVGTGAVLNSSAERPLTQFLKSLASRASFELSAITIRIVVPDTVPKDALIGILRTLRRTLSDTVRQTDIACERDAMGIEYVILAPGCPPTEARRLADKLRTALEQAAPKGSGVRANTTASSLLASGAMEASA
jgi:hypothetical protein